MKFNQYKAQDVCDLSDSAYMNDFMPNQSLTTSFLACNHIATLVLDLLCSRHAYWQHCTSCMNGLRWRLRLQAEELTGCGGVTGLPAGLGSLAMGTLGRGTRLTGAAGVATGAGPAGPATGVGAAILAVSSVIFDEALRCFSRKDELLGRDSSFVTCT